MSRRGWLATLAALGVIDTWAAFIRHDGTFSHAVRETFRTDTTAGKIRLCVAWLALTAIVLPHWCHWPANRRCQ